MSGSGPIRKIALVAACPFPLARGTPIRIERMAHSLAERGHLVDVYTYHHGMDRAVGGFRVKRIAGIPGYRRTSPGPSLVKLSLLDPQLAWKLLRGARANRYDVIHAHHVEGLLAALPAARLLNIPLVYDVHTLLESELPYYRSAMPRALFGAVGRRVDRMLPRLADHVVAVSEDIRNLVLQATKQPRSVSLIPNGVELELFPPPREHSDSSSAPEHLVYAGNLAAYQGFELLLEAFARARATRKDLRLRVITEDPLNGYAVLAASLGVRDAIDVSSVELSDLPQALAAADVAVNPRVDCTGLPQKLLNYMAAGCPIVSFESSAKHIAHETSGLIVADRDVGGMAAAILRLLKDRTLARRLGHSAQQTARAEHGWPRVAERVEAVYNAVIERERQ